MFSLRPPVSSMGAKYIGPHAPVERRGAAQRLAMNSREPAQRRHLAEIVLTVS
jgi:hypothetical protein